mmetsp:Transcript_2948/g.3496  ORF Transcript_2948/g.3496 Transcript_2948/m.3496 type:complete len:116 (-) Transcript_2948:577-924(-)
MESKRYDFEDEFIFFYVFSLSASFSSSFSRLDSSHEHDIHKPTNNIERITLFQQQHHRHRQPSTQSPIRLWRWDKWVMRINWNVRLEEQLSMHDMFNFLIIAIFFPLELITGYLF